MLRHFFKLFFTIIPYAGRKNLSSVFGRKYQMIPTGVNTICLLFEFHNIWYNMKIAQAQSPTSSRWLHPTRLNLDCFARSAVSQWRWEGGTGLLRFARNDDYHNGASLRGGVPTKQSSRLIRLLFWLDCFARSAVSQWRTKINGVLLWIFWRIIRSPAAKICPSSTHPALTGEPSLRQREGNR